MNAFKRSLLALALTAGVSSSVLLAQPPEQPGSPPAQAGERRGPGMRMNAEARLKQLAEALELTEEQKNQIKPILAEEAAALKAVWEDKSLSREDGREKMRAVRDSFAAKIEALLTPEQKTKFEKTKSMRGPGGPRREREEKK